MSKGICILSQRNSKTDYIKEAYLLALSVKKSNPNLPVTLVTNDTVTPKQQKVFDEIKEIPWTDAAADSDWKVENRWKLYYASPYEHTIVLDADCIILNNIEHIFDFVKGKDLVYANTARTYRGEVVTSDYYRKTFTANNLPNVYSGFQYFRKSSKAAEFYKLLELIFNNWNAFYDKFCKEHYPKNVSMDVSAAIALKLMELDNDCFLNSEPVKFTHMKPMVQNWVGAIGQSWIEQVESCFFTSDCKLYVGNHLQKDIFHYVEDEFCNDTVIQIYEEALNL